MSNVLIINSADFSQNALGTNYANRNYLPKIKRGEFSNSEGTLVVVVGEDNKIKITYTGNGSIASMYVPLEKSLSLPARTYYSHTRNAAPIVSDSACTIIFGGTTILSFANKNNIRKCVLSGTLTDNRMQIYVPAGISNCETTAQLSIEDVGYVTQFPG